jgi:hypothetical protein
MSAAADAEAAAATEPPGDAVGAAGGTRRARAPCGAVRVAGARLRRSSRGRACVHNAPRSTSAGSPVRDPGACICWARRTAAQTIRRTPGRPWSSCTASGAGAGEGRGAPRGRTEHLQRVWPPRAHWDAAAQQRRSCAPLAG